MSPVSPLLDVQDIYFMQDGTTLLQPVSLTLNAGESLLVTGPSGSGKSTLLKILASLLEPSGGQILFKGQPSGSIRPEHYRQRVSYCFQTPVLFGDTVYDNLALPWQIRKKTVDRARIRDGLRQMDLPETILAKKPEQLSGGEKQRVGLLRNLQFLPDVLLLDEITSALDEENRQRINQLIASLTAKQGVATVSISHHVAEIRQAKRLLTLPQRCGSHIDESA
ncbi:iron efflux ABC transporter ATP-binding subunit FetA [Erwinia mallotivora]|uniref:iron efflux ABC transporter ATP-binding subunit FetA n=1 Tax=Erwinia mallotivora TaxID=69222 RepID=UPI0021C01BA0|nr:ATP-binding cassette domain-containing protein [Erwinia mallotivora]